MVIGAAAHVIVKPYLDRMLGRDAASPTSAPTLSAARRLAEERLGRRVVLGRHGAQLAPPPRRAAPARSRSRAAPASCPSAARAPRRSPRAEARGQHAVERGRRAAALDVAEHGGARLEAGALLDLALEPLADPAEPLVAELVASRRRPTSIVPSAGVAPSATTTIEK